LSPKRLALVRRIAIAVWVLGVVIFTLYRGVAVDRTSLLVIVCSGLLVSGIGRRRAVAVVRDWLPFAAVLFLYDFTRGAASLLGRQTEWYPQLKFDRWIGGGIEPTVWLQAHLKMAHATRWEAASSLVYVSYYVAPYLVAGIWWLIDRTEWRKFVLRFVAINVIGLVGFILVPSAPPWAAAQCSVAEVAAMPTDPPCLQARNNTDHGLLVAAQAQHPGAASYVERITTRGWDRLGLNQAKSLLDEGQASVNLVAAVPSLHAAVSLLVSIFLWPRVRKRWRPILVAYPPAMAFVLVYGAEHYVFDILLGWLLTAVVCFALSWWEARRARREDTASDDVQPPGDAQPPGSQAAGGEVAGPDTLNGPHLART
jgi:hypothetical protein